MTTKSALTRILVAVAAVGTITTLGMLAAIHGQSQTMGTSHLDELLDAVVALRRGETQMSSARPNTSPTTSIAASTTGRRILKYDEAGPQPIPGTARSHALPNAIPATRTIPRQYAEDKQYHISQRTNTSRPISILPKAKRSGLPEHLLGEYNWKHSYATDHRTLYLYNPSILPLHNACGGCERANDVDALAAEELQELTGGDPTVRYVVTYRAYTGCNCFGPDPDRIIMKAGEQLSYLAVALLDEHLDVLPGTDVLIDLNAGPRRTKYWRQPLEDCRLFSLRGGIYLLCNEEMKRIKIRRRMETIKTKTNADHGRRDDHRIPYDYEHIYGDGLQITLIGHNGKVGGGKNFNIFRSLAPNNRSVQDISTGTFDYYLQTYPSPHRYRRLVIPDGKIGDGEATLNVKHPDWPDRGPDDPMAPGEIPPPSFDTPDAINEIQKCSDGSTNCTDPISVSFFHDEDHGSACCIMMNLRGKQVMVGISHQKLSPRKPFWQDDLLHRYDRLGVDRFVSRFIAYDAIPPFDIVARSGWFCLGFASEDEGATEGGNTLAGRNTNARLDLFNDTYSCPIIHFVSGLSEVVGDEERLIIAYGVNDCHPRLFMVKKGDIVKILEYNNYQ